MFTTSRTFCAAVMAFKLGQQWSDLFMNFIVKHLDQATRRARYADDKSPVGAGGDNSPYVAARQSPVYLPGLVQQANCPAADTRREMHAPSGDRQLRQSARFSCQTPTRGLALGLCPPGPLRAGGDSGACTTRRTQHWRADMGHTTEVATVLKARLHKPQSLNHTVALGFADREKERFDPHIQAQPTNPKHAWHFVPPQKRRVVIHWQPIATPGFSRSAARVGAPSAPPCPY
jgi:hypothetical protein